MRSGRGPLQALIISSPGQYWRREEERLLGTAALQHCMITNLPSPPLSGAPSELAFVSLISQMAKKWYLEVNEIHMNTSAQHSRGFTIYKMIIDSKVLLLPGNLGCPAPLPPLEHRTASRGKPENEKVCLKFMTLL